MNQPMDLQNPEQTCLTNEVDSAQEKQCTEMEVEDGHVIENGGNKHSCFQRNKENIKRCRNVLFPVLYLSYYGYAMYCHFGDEESIRLTVLTGFVLAYLSWNIAFEQGCIHIRWNSFLHNVRTMYSYGRRPKIIQWCMYAIVTAGFVTYLIINVALKEPSKLRSLGGILIFILIMFISSNNRTKINWHCVFWGTSLQCLLGYAVIKSEYGIIVIKWFSNRLSEFITCADVGSKFVFGASFKDHKFAMQVMPAIIFFFAVINALIYLGTVQFVVRTFGRLLAVTLRVSAPEAINACANIALTGLESIALIKEYAKTMPMSGLFALLTNWFASCNGSALLLFMAFGIPLNYLLTASAMSAPAALAFAKLVYPDDDIEDKVNEAIDIDLDAVVNDIEEDREDMTILNELPNHQPGKHVQNECKDETFTASRKDKPNSIWDALVAGTQLGMKTVANIIGILIVSLALIEFANRTIGWFGDRVNMHINLNIILGYMFYAFAYLMGVDVDDCLRAGRLLGIRMLSAPGAAYLFLGDIIDNRQRLEDYIVSFHDPITYNRSDDIFLPHLNQTLVGGVFSERSELISTFALCGMASLPNIGIMLGALCAIIPERATQLSKLAFRAMFAGTIASFLTACVAGILS